MPRNSQRAYHPPEKACRHHSSHSARSQKADLKRHVLPNATAQANGGNSNVARLPLAIQITVERQMSKGKCQKASAKRDALLRVNATVIQQPNTARKQVNFDEGLICCGSSQSNLSSKADWAHRNSQKGRSTFIEGLSCDGGPQCDPKPQPKGR